jgi:hypothetical protein
MVWGKDEQAPLGMAILPAGTDIRGFRTQWAWIRVRNLAHR